MIPHVMIIQSTYTDEALSKRRLEITKCTCVNSLWFQIQKPIVHVAVDPLDPYIEERKAAFLSTNCEVRFLYRNGWKLYRENWELPEGRKIVSRMDDDDVIAQDFCLLTRNATPETGEMNLIWPNGYVYWRETPFLLHHKGIQFVTLVTDKMKDPHQEQHWQYHKSWPTRTVSRAPGWIWVRHGDAASSTLPRYRTKPLRSIDSKRIPVNLRAILRAIAPSGTASGNYVEHANKKQIEYVLAENAKHG